MKKKRQRLEITNRHDRGRGSLMRQGRRVKTASVSALKWIWVFIAAGFFLSSAEASDMVTIGAVEDVGLVRWGVKIPARIDTGAATSSIDVCDYTVKEGEVHFTLAERCGGFHLALPLVGMRRVQATEGAEERPVIELEICIASVNVRTLVTLNDRSQLEYPFLVGRNVLEGKFVVDVSRSKTMSPNCPGFFP